MNITNYRSGKIVESPNVAFTYQVAGTPRDFNTKLPTNNLQWSNVQNYLGDYIVYPYGVNNDIPQLIKDTVDNSYNVPGFLKRKTELLWGNGPKLYVDELSEEGKDIRKRVVDKDVQKWLDSWCYEEYLLKCCVDYQHLQGTFTRFELNKGSRVGKPLFSKLHHVNPSNARLARLRKSSDNTPTHILVGTWNFTHINAISATKAYDMFNFTQPFKFDNSIFYSNFHSFCTDYYTVPDLYGSLEWINRSTAVPLIFKAFSINAVNLKYHIVSPAGFWDKKREQIKTKCLVDKVTYEESMLSEFEDAFLKQIADVLSGDVNAGKFLHTTKGMVVKGHDLVEEGWEIKVLDQKVKDFVTAHISISDKADKAISAAVNVHPVLANMTDSGKANSGSEQIYALLNYLNTGVDIQEMIICKSLNYALKANFPEKGIKVGFFHNVPELQQNVSPENRTKNNQ